MKSDKQGQVLVISGCSGSGKGTVIKELLAMREDFCYSISATTRKPREGEAEGVNYFFVTRERFRENIDKGEMLEYAEYCGNLYGTPRSFIYSKIEAGINVVLEIEVVGAMQVKEALPQAVLVFISPPDYSTLKQRLSGRGTEAPEEIEKRLEAAEREIKEALNYNYLLLNHDGQAAETAKSIIKIAQGNYADCVDKEKFIYNFIGG